MNEKEICHDLRHEFGKSGLALLIYYGIMNVVVTLVAIVDAVILVLRSSTAGGVVISDAVMDQMMDRIISNGWGYILAIAIGCLLMLLWKKKHFCFVEIWKTEKPMTVGSFVALTCIFISGQALFQVFSYLMEWFFNLFGMSVMDSIEIASSTGDTLIMFLYVSIFAPVFEEILFRGLILRSLQPYGKKFAILASAFLFGIFHGNIVQSPYAFAVGLVLGYVAVEHSMVWAMVLHMINNLLLGDTLTRVTQFLPYWIQELIFYVLIWGCTVAAVVILIVKRREVAAYFREGKIHPLCLKSFFTSPAVIVLTCVLCSNILITLLMQLIA